MITAHMLASFTGVDDQTDLKELCRIYAMASQLGIATEYGLLVYPEKEGRGRNASFKVQQEVAARLPAAAHLCGEQVFRELLSPIARRTRMKQLRCFERVQVNINARNQDFTDDEIYTVYSTLLDFDLTVIIQYHENSAKRIEACFSKLSRSDTNTLHILNDNSRGMGICPAQWATSLPNTIQGFAGGLSPDNLAIELPKIQKAALKHSQSWDYWIDMESGIRENNVFCTDKVAAVIEVIHSFNTRSIQPAKVD
jgi:hypothetical protein